MSRFPGPPADPILSSGDHQQLFLLVFVIAAGIGMQWLASRLRFPVILLLLAAGVLAGPVSALIFEKPLLQPDLLFGKLLAPFVDLAVAVVLFEGGLTLNLKEARHVGKTLARLILSGLLVGFALTTLSASFLGGLDFSTSCVLGAILVVTGPTVILPLLRGARIASRPATLLKWEGIVNDPLGVLLALFVVQTVGVVSTRGASYEFLHHIIAFVGTSMLASVLGAVFGYGLHRALDRGWIAEHIKSPVIFASVLVVYSLSIAFARESGGLLAVTVMGIVLTNVDNAHIEDVRRFKEQFSTLLLSALFILLSARLELEALKDLIGAPLLFIFSVVFLVRPAVAWVACWGSDLSFRERLLIGWIAPRGVVAAAMAGAIAPQLSEDSETAHLLVPIVFGVIIVTVLLHGLSLGPMARRMGLAHEEGSGILVVGASMWAVSLCQHLAEAGANVILADTRYRFVSRARLEGLEVHHGDVLAEESAMEIPMESVSWVFAASDEDAYNALVCLRFAAELGRERVLQLTPITTEAGHESASHMKGRNPWGGNATHKEITSRFWRGGAIKTTPLTAEFGWKELREKHPGALFLFAVVLGRLQVLSGDAAPPSGAQVIYLTAPAEDGANYPPVSRT